MLKHVYSRLEEAIAEPPWARVIGRINSAGHNASLQSLVECLESERDVRSHLGAFLDRWRATRRPMPMFVPCGERAAIFAFSLRFTRERMVSDSDGWSFCSAGLDPASLHAFAHRSSATFQSLLGWILAILIDHLPMLARHFLRPFNW